MEGVRFVITLKINVNKNYWLYQQQLSTTPFES